MGSHSFGLTHGAVLAATTLMVPGLLGVSGGQEDRLLRALRERAAAAEAAVYGGDAAVRAAATGREPARRAARLNMLRAINAQ
ncbi:hypothetical protein [Kitasatospora mediocidica]|uniref:hypothetical protein n=1 Tax=Kitasatospora mediocidica TaxID=58352 RepID=UPI00056D2D9B|nr:hypothetical protein [Kitasatospora mediocidica]